MTGPPSKSKQGGSSDSVDLTRALKQLTISADTVDDVFEEQGGAALLLSRDRDARKWGARWLGQSSLQVSVPPDPDNAMEIARTMRPDVIVIEASLTSKDGSPIFVLLEEAADISAAVIVLCSNAREIEAAVAAGVFDVARKPFEWQLIGNRAKRALQIQNHQSSFDEANAALQEAIEIANVARTQLRSQESFEPLTGLPNKTKFIDLLQRGMRACDRDGTGLAVAVIGFTRFRLVIEAMGQGQADRLLTEIGRKLGECLSGASIDPVPAEKGLRTAAMGSLDQFCFGVMIAGTGSDESMAGFQQQVVESLSRPIQIAGQMVHLSACLGVAQYPQDAESVDSLLQRADNAMRDAQSRGGGFQYYCSATDAAAARKLKIEHMLHESLPRNELSLVYQPIVDVATSELRSVEALLRWRQPDGSFIAPDEFIQTAEESGLIIRIGEFSLDRACEQYSAWRQARVPVPHICVNVAKAQLMSPGFVQVVRRILEKHEMDPTCLELEISERGVLSGDYDVITQLHELKDLGVRLSIDDFGTGDSAIAYLKELPVDVLKIDRSYIAGFDENGKDVAIASAMVALGQRLNMTVIAEGVETMKQLSVLRALGCNSYQGYYIARPLMPELFADFVRNSSKIA